MKKLVALILAMLMVFAMAGCDKVEQVVNNAADKVADKIAEKVDSTGENTNNTNETAMNNEGTNDELNGYATERPLPTAVETPAPMVTSNLAGTYHLEAIVENGVSAPVEELPLISIRLDADQTGLYYVGNEDTSMKVTWSQSGNTVTILSELYGESDPLIMTVSGNQLIEESGSGKVVFTKGSF